jgi:hypothetical protein
VHLLHAVKQALTVEGYFKAPQAISPKQAGTTFHPEPLVRESRLEVEVEPPSIYLNSKSDSKRRVDPSAPSLSVDSTTVSMPKADTAIPLHSSVASPSSLSEPLSPGLPPHTCHRKRDTSMTPKSKSEDPAAYSDSNRCEACKLIAEWNRKRRQLLASYSRRGSTPWIGAWSVKPNCYSVPVEESTLPEVIPIQLPVHCSASPAFYAGGAASGSLFKEYPALLAGPVDREKERVDPSRRPSTSSTPHKEPWIPSGSAKLSIAASHDSWMCASPVSDFVTACDAFLFYCGGDRLLLKLLCHIAPDHPRAQLHLRLAAHWLLKSLQRRLSQAENHCIRPLHPVGTSRMITRNRDRQ